jgi:hypothetical protein
MLDPIPLAITALSLTVALITLISRHRLSARHRIMKRELRAAITKRDRQIWNARGNNNG